MAANDEQISAAKLEPLASPVKDHVPHADSHGVIGEDEVLQSTHIAPFPEHHHPEASIHHQCDGHRHSGHGKHMHNEGHHKKKVMSPAEGQGLSAIPPGHGEGMQQSVHAPPAKEGARASSGGMAGGMKEKMEKAKEKVGGAVKGMTGQKST